MLDCSIDYQTSIGSEASEIASGASAEFQRHHRFNVGLVIDQLRILAGH